MKRILFLLIFVLSITTSANAKPLIVSTRVQQALANSLANDGTWDTISFSDGTSQTTAGGGGDSISINGSAVVDPDFVTAGGDITVTDTSNTITFDITSDKIVNDDINSAAAIAATKLESAVIVATEIDTAAELDVIVADENIIVATEIDTFAEIDAIIADETIVGTSTTDTFTNKTIDANGTGNSITNIDVADLANGTDGELITWDASASPTTVAAGTSGQVLTSNGAGSAPTFQAASSSVAHNILINGGFEVVERFGTDTSFTDITFNKNNDDTYHFDRWYTLSDGNNIIDITQEVDGGVTGAETYYRADVETTAKKFGLAQIVENNNTKAFAGGSGKVSLSFECRVSNATKLSDIRAVVLAWSGAKDNLTSDIISTWNAEGTRPTYIANVTAENTDSDLGVTTSWARYTIEDIAVDTAGMKNLIVFIYQNNVATNDTAGVFLDVTNVQVESGTSANTFQYRDHETERQSCRRYFQKIRAAASGQYGVLQAVSTTLARGKLYFTDKRAVPTITFTASALFSVLKGGGGDQSINTLSFAEIGTEGAKINAAVDAVLTAGNASQLADNVSMNLSAIFVDAEL